MSLTKTDLPVGSANKTYGKAVLTLDNCLLPEEILNNTPSRVDGLDEDSETSLRIWGCELIQTAGILLQLPQVAMATGQVLYQRFYYSKSLVRYDAEITSMACICLASKIEEAPRRIRDVINVFNHIKQINEQRKIQPVILDQNYIELKTKVIKAERRVLKELGFCVHIKHPHKIIVMYLQVLLIENNRKMMQMAWNYMNDSLRTNVFVRYSPEVIACACIYLSARVLKLPLPKNPNWYELFGVTESHIKDVCLTILRLYARPKPDMEEFNKKIAEIRKAYQESRVKHRFETEPKIEETEKVNTGGAYNAFGAFISRSITEDQQPKHEKENKPSSKNRRSRSPVDRKRETKRNRSRSRHRSKERDRPKKRSKDRKRSSRSPSRSRSNKKSDKQESSPRIDRNRSPKKHKSSNKKYHSEKSRYRSRSRSLSRNEKHRHRSPENNKKSASNDKYYSEVRSSKYKKDYYLYDTNDK